MNETEFDEIFKSREILVETDLLAYFRDIDFYKIGGNLQYSSHRKADLKGVIARLSRFCEEHPECKTFGELKTKFPGEYKGQRMDIILCVNKFHYHI